MLKQEEIRGRQDDVVRANPSPGTTTTGLELDQPAPVSRRNLFLIIGCAVLFIGLLWGVHH